MQNIFGSQVLTVTPFHADGALDEKSLRNLIDFVIDGGSHGIIGLGTTGEFFSLSLVEKLKVIDITIDQTKGRVPVSIGCTSASTYESIELAQYAERKGAAGLLLAPPYYFPLKEENVILHISAVANSVKIPIIVYDGGGGREIPISSLLQLRQKAPNITHLKLTVRSPEKVKQIKESLGKDFKVLCGDEPMLVLELADGADGMTLGAGNVQPKVVADIYNLYKEQKIQEAQKIFFEKLMPQVSILNLAIHEYIQCFKEVLVWKKIIESAFVRPPLLPLKETRRQAVKDVMHYLHVL